MDSLDSIGFLLLPITIATMAGFAGIGYCLREIHRDLTRPEHERSEHKKLSDVTDRPEMQESAVSTPPRREIDPRKAGSLEGNPGAITRKYGLTSFMLSTADDLLTGSTKEHVEDEAARCSYLYTQGKLQDEAGVELFGIPYCGEAVIGIACPSGPLSAELTNAL